MDTRSVGGDFAALAALLTGARGEWVRAQGDTPDARRRLCAGLLMRAALGRDAIVSAGPYGKPFVVGGPPMNVSHAGDYAVLATAAGAVGVDVERVRDVDAARLAARFFHAQEAAYVAAAADARDAICTIWTLKESYIKAEGTGLHTLLPSFCVLPMGERDAKLRPDAPYRFRRYPFAEGYRLSVCAADADFSETVVALDARAALL